jgi:hypothetical protein
MRELRHFFDSLNIPLEPRTMACPLNAFVQVSRYAAGEGFSMHIV